MKQILMRQLEKGDVFTEEMKIHGRKSFEALENPDPDKKTLKCYDRVDLKEVNKSLHGYIILLRKGKNNG